MNVGPNTQSYMARKGVRLMTYPPQPILHGPKGRKKKKKKKLRWGKPGKGWEAEQKLRVCRSCHDELEATFAQQLEMALASGWNEEEPEQEQRWAAK